MSLPASLHWSDEDLRVKAALEEQELLELQDSVSRNDFGTKRAEATSLIKHLAESLELKYKNLVADAQEFSKTRENLQSSVTDLQQQAAKLKLQKSASENAMHERAALATEIETALNAKVCGIPLSTPKEALAEEREKLLSEIEELEQALATATEEFHKRKALSSKLEQFARDLHERIETSYTQRVQQ